MLIHEASYTHTAVLRYRYCTLQDPVEVMFSMTCRFVHGQGKRGQEGFVSMCACTEPVRTGIGAVCVEYDRPKWPITMLNHTDIPGTEYVFFFNFWHPMLVRPAMKRLFCLKTKNGLGRFAPSALPHYNQPARLAIRRAKLIINRLSVSSFLVYK